MILLFDFGGTLDGDGERWAVRFHRAYRALGGRLDLARFEPWFRRSDALLAQYPAIRTLDFTRMVVAQAELLVELVEDGRAIDPRLLARRFHDETLAVVARNRPLLAHLADRHRLGIVSNFCGNLDLCLDELELAPLFAGAYDSAVVGIAKPDPRIFHEALNALGGSPRAAWMVGDNFDADVRPAAALGMRTCWLAPADRAAPVEGLATARIAWLPDFPALVA